MLIENYCSYVDVYDLCDAVMLAIETDLPGHEVFYVASPDTIGGHPLVETVERYYGADGIEFRPLGRTDASAISSAKAERLLGADAAAELARLSRRAGKEALMKTRRLGSAGPRVSRVGFGSWAIGGPWRFGWGEVDDGESVAAIRHAIERGVNWIDTAAVYGLGHSEEVVVGEAVKPFHSGEDNQPLHEVRPRLGGVARGRGQERPAPGVDPARVRGEPAQAGGGAESTSTNSTGPTGRPGRRSRSPGA